MINKVQEVCEEGNKQKMIRKCRSITNISNEIDLVKEYFQYLYGQFLESKDCKNLKPLTKNKDKGTFKAFTPIFTKDGQLIEGYIAYRNDLDKSQKKNINVSDERKVLKIRAQQLLSNGNDAVAVAMFDFYPYTRYSDSENILVNAGQHTVYDWIKQPTHANGKKMEIKETKKKHFYSVIIYHKSHNMLESYDAKPYKDLNLKNSSIIKQFTNDDDKQFFVNTVKSVMNYVFEAMCFSMVTGVSFLDIKESNTLLTKNDRGQFDINLIDEATAKINKDLCTSMNCFPITANHLSPDLVTYYNMSQGCRIFYQNNIVPLLISSVKRTLQYLYDQAIIYSSGQEVYDQYTYLIDEINTIENFYRSLKKNSQIVDKKAKLVEYVKPKVEAYAKQKNFEMQSPLRLLINDRGSLELNNGLSDQYRWKCELIKKQDNKLVNIMNNSADKEKQFLNTINDLESQLESIKKLVDKIFRIDTTTNLSVTDMQNNLLSIILTYQNILRKFYTLKVTYGENEQKSNDNYFHLYTVKEDKINRRIINVCQILHNAIVILDPKNNKLLLQTIRNTTSSPRSIENLINLLKAFVKKNTNDNNPQNEQKLRTENYQLTLSVYNVINKYKELHSRFEQGFDKFYRLDHSDKLTYKPSLILEVINMLYHITALLSKFKEINQDNNHDETMNILKKMRIHLMKRLSKLQQRPKNKQIFSKGSISQSFRKFKNHCQDSCFSCFSWSRPQDLKEDYTSLVNCIEIITAEDKTLFSQQKILLKNNVEKANKFERKLFDTTLMEATDSSDYYLTEDDILKLCCIKRRNIDDFVISYKSLYCQLEKKNVKDYYRISHNTNSSDKPSLFLFMITLLYQVVTILNVLHEAKTNLNNNQNKIITRIDKIRKSLIDNLLVLKDWGENQQFFSNESVKKALKEFKNGCSSEREFKPSNQPQLENDYNNLVNKIGLREKDQEIVNKATFFVSNLKQPQNSLNNINLTTDSHP